MAWIIPSENMLDTQQREFVENMRNMRNSYIKGFAGSGKSVLLAYAAKKAKDRFPDCSIALVVFTKSLVEMFRAAFKEIGVSGVTIETFFAFMKSSSSYDYILCDEVQDLTPRILTEMNRRGNHVIVAGDCNQSLYSVDPRWKEATVSPNSVASYISGNTVELGIIHRLSRSLISAVQKLLPNMNIFRAKTDMTKEDTQIRLGKADSQSDEVKYIINTAQKAVNVGQTAGVLLPSHDQILEFANNALELEGHSAWNRVNDRYGHPDYNSLNNYLQRCGINMKYVGNGYGSFSENDHCIVLMTYHSAKGLDFDCVFLPFANSNLFGDKSENEGKTLFMVGMTRARHELYITYTSFKPCPYIDTFKSTCSQIDISNDTTTVASNSNDWGF